MRPFDEFSTPFVESETMIEFGSGDIVYMPTNDIFGFHPLCFKFDLSYRKPFYYETPEDINYGFDYSLPM